MTDSTPTPARPEGETIDDRITRVEAQADRIAEKLDRYLEMQRMNVHLEASLLDKETGRAK